MKHFCGHGARNYITFDYPNSKPDDNTVLTNISSINCSSKVYISGLYMTSQGFSTSFVYKGCISGKGTFYDLNFPEADSTQLFDVIQYDTSIRAVGQCIIHGQILGCLYQGSLQGVGDWTIIRVPISTSTILHGIAHDLIIGEYNSNDELNIPFIYNMISKVYHTVIIPDATSVQVNSILYNGKDLYTLCGSLLMSTGDTRMGYIADWTEIDRITNLQTYTFKDQSLITNFNSICKGCCHNTYSVSGIYFSATNGLSYGLLAKIKRNKDNTFDMNAKWETIKYHKSNIYNSAVLGTIVIGTYININSEIRTGKGFISQKDCC